jgi:GAF domain
VLVTTLPAMTGDDAIGTDAHDRPWRWVAAGAVFVVVSPVAAIASRNSHGGWFWFWVTVQAGTTLLAFLIPQVRQVRAEQRQEEAEQSEFEVRVDARVRMNDALDPVIRLLGSLMHAPPSDRDQTRAKAIPLVLKTAAELIGPERARACWFRLEAGPPRRLVPTDSAGRSGSPTTIFIEGTDAGDAAIGMVLADEDRLCEDILADPPPGWDATKNREYRTFVSVSVIAGDTAYGMLTLDALEPGELTTDDMRLLRLMAGALAVALSAVSVE